MAPASRRPGPAEGGGIPPALLKRAIDLLKDPAFQQQIIDHGGPMVDAVKRWGPSVAHRVGDVGDRFGQRGLERRLTNMREVVAALSGDSPALAATLRPVTESLDEVGRMLKVSDKLSFAKRKRAHLKIDDVLDDLEAGLLKATFPADPTGQDE